MVSEICRFALVDAIDGSSARTNDPTQRDYPQIEGNIALLRLRSLVKSILHWQQNFFRDIASWNRCSTQ